MCGIAGICGVGLPEAPAEALRRMLEAISHRGPDDEGTWSAPDGGCFLGHKRLSIIDLATGHQPMTNEDENLWITFNGCIYNYQDLARLLGQKGHRFRTSSDTEVVIHAYEEWGPDCVARFNGMWAFAIWDCREKTLFCSRDRLGIKPFHYAWDGKRFAFASEIKGLLAAGVVEPKVNATGLRQYLTFQFCLDETTLFAGVERLRPGHNLLLRPGKAPQVSAYWDFSFEIDEEHDEAYFVDQLEALLEDAVRLRLRADVPLGAHLSGGLDSSTVVGLSRRLLGDAPIKTFTGAFREGAAYDESRYARLVAEANSTEYFETYPSAGDFAACMEKIIWHMDEPAAGPGVFPQYWVSRLAAGNVKVVLGGQGGDEIFIGYARYLLAYLEECIKGAIEDTAGRGRYVTTLETIVSSLPSLEKYVPMLKDFWAQGLFEEPARRYFRLMDRFSDARGFLAADFPADSQRTFEEFHAVFEGRGSAALVNRMMCFDVKAHLPSLLHAEDRTSMAWGLESRVPLLDHRLVELMAAVPPVIKFRNGQLKGLLRQAARELVPAEVMNRKDKMGFPVPFSSWLKNELRDFVSDVLLDRRCRQRGLFNSAELEKALAAPRPFSRSLWGALCLELWHRKFIDG